MIAKSFKRGAFLILCIILTLSLAACSLPDLFNSDGNKDDPSATGNSNNKENDLPVSIARKSGVYTILILNEGATDGSLASLFLCAIDTAEDNGISFLQIPAKTYVNNAYSSIAGVYSGTYSSSVAEGNTADRARESAILAVKSVIESCFCVYVNYYLCANPNQLGLLCEKIGGVDINVPTVMMLGNGETLLPGEQSLGGNSMAAFLTYSGFSEAVLMNVYKTVISSIYTKAKSQVGNDTVSLFVLEIRSCVVTDIPSSGGEDIFFTRKLLNTDTESVKFTQVASQTCAVNAGLVANVICKSEAVTVINEYLKVYADKLSADMFDSEKMFTTDSNQLASIIYTGNGAMPQIYTAENIKNGQLPLT